MRAAITDLTPHARLLQLRQAIAPALLTAGSLLIFAALRNVLINVASGDGFNCLILDVLACDAAALLCGIRYDEISPMLRVMGRGIGAVVLVTIVFDATTLLYAPAPYLAGDEGWFFRFGTLLGIAAGIASIWRPSFLLPLMFHYVAFRHQYNIAGGIDISETDYLSMMDVGEYCVVGALVVALASRAAPLSEERERRRHAACALIWACAVGAHLGNYFISAWTKIRVGGDDPFLWLLHNPTQTSILIGLERGDNPLATWPWLVQLVWDGVVGAGVGLNLFVIGLQFFAPIAIAHRRLLMAFVLLFDLFHIGVYFTLGAMFAYWIAVNAIILASATRMTDRQITPLMQITTMAAALFGHFLFYTSHLGWLDGAKLASPSFVAETKDGRYVPIPSVYFGMRSYSIAQTLMYVPDGHFPMRIGGNSYNWADWEDAQTCGPDVRNHQKSAATLPAIEAMVVQTDAAMREHPEVKTDNLYYFYPHHMVANPFLFREFNALSMNDIARYHYVVESVCLGLKNGVLTRDVRHRSDQVIDVER